MKTLNTLAIATAMVALSSGAFAETITLNDIKWNSGKQYTTTSANVNAQSQVRLNSAQVRGLQQALRAEGYNIAVDGAFGPQTARALRSYQAANKLAVTGQANRETLAKLNLNSNTYFNSNAAINADTKAQTALRLNSNEVRGLQSALRAQGYNIAVDGAYGPQTASALRSFQASQNLAVTGQANRETLAKLNLNSNTYFNSNVAINADTKAQTALRLNSNEVRGLQSALRARGYNIAVDGAYGPQTASALRSYQASQNLAVTGQANRETLAKLNLMSGTTTTASGTSTTTTTTGAGLSAQTALQLDTDSVRNLQRALRAKGYNVPVSGVMNQTTVDALASYQANNNLAATGKANFETLAKLDLLSHSSSTTVNAAAAGMLPSIFRLDNGEASILQQALRSEGYNIGVDGIIGQSTINALRAYQADNNLSATGELDQQTLISLNLLQAMLR